MRDGNVSDSYSAFVASSEMMLPSWFLFRQTIGISSSLNISFIFWSMHSSGSQLRGAGVVGADVDVGVGGGVGVGVGVGMTVDLQPLA